MAGIRIRVAVLAIAVAAALIGGLAWNLVRTQAQGRASLLETLDRRTALTGRLIGGAFTASNTPEAARAQFGGSRRSLTRAIAAQAAAAGADQRVMVLDARGRVLAASSPRVAADRSLVARNRHLRLALAGRTALSDAFRDERGRWMVEIAVPFDTPSGRRVLAGSGPIAIVRNFTGGVFDSAVSIPGTLAVLVDGAGRTLSAAGVRDAPRAASIRQLAATLRRGHDGTYGDRTFVSAPVPASSWRIALSVPTARLYAAVDDGPATAAWLLFAAFAAAICALVALGVAAARGARRLAAATEREHAARELAYARLHDALTGLPTRALFQDRADRAIESARRRSGSLAVLFMDVDNFKRINDSLGHAGGDAVLREVARRLSASVRAADTVSRFGGDEFVVLCEDIDPSAALELAATIAGNLDASVLVRDRPVPVTFSVGVAVHAGRHDTRTAADLVRDADAAMYRAKDLGRSRVELFDGRLHRHSPTRLDAEVALRRAIEHDELCVHYQPIVALPDGAVRGVEALVRWRRPGTDALVPPGEFIPLAEQTGLISQLDDWVLHNAIREVGDWARRGLIDDGFSLSVNVSARLLTDPRLPDTVADALAGWERAASTLCLEITESAVMSDVVLAARTLERLDALGVRLALDDFGVGYSSLGQVRSLHVSILKLDRSFVAGMSSPHDRGIVEAAAALARALDLDAVAEGVETAGEAEQLAAIGFPYAQGYYFGRPADGPETIARVSASSVG